MNNKYVHLVLYNIKYKLVKWHDNDCRANNSCLSIHGNNRMLNVHLELKFTFQFCCRDHRELSYEVFMVVTVLLSFYNKYFRPKRILFY